MQQKTIGLIGGIGWASSAEYYRLINELTVERLGISHSAKILMLSLDQFDFTSRAAAENRQEIEDFLVEQVARVKAAGADFFLLCANGAHRFIPAIRSRIDLPFVSIVEETAHAVEIAKIKRVGLLGVKQTMSGTFYSSRLAESGIETIAPAASDQDAIHDIIYKELIHNRINEESRGTFVRIIRDLQASGAEGVILGCTEIPLLIDQAHVAIPVFNTTYIHCAAAVGISLARSATEMAREF